MAEEDMVEFTAKGLCEGPSSAEKPRLAGTQQF